MKKSNSKIVLFCTAIAAVFVLFGIAPGYGASYYVKPASQGGDNSHTGLSDAQAWATFSEVNAHNFQTGDDVFLICGGIWTQQRIIVDWSGTSDNNVVIGAYYMNGGTETIGVNV